MTTTDPLVELDKSNLEQSMRAEVAEIEARRPDITTNVDGPEYDGVRVFGQSDIHLNADTYLSSILWDGPNGAYCTVTIGSGESGRWVLYMTPAALGRLRDFLSDVELALSEVGAVGSRGEAEDSIRDAAAELAAL